MGRKQLRPSIFRTRKCVTYFSDWDLFFIVAVFFDGNVPLLSAGIWKITKVEYKRGHDRFGIATYTRTIVTTLYSGFPEPLPKSS